MSWVQIIYVVLAIQTLFFFLHFTGNWFIMKVVVEFGQVCFHIALCIVESSIKWICPWLWQRKNLKKELILITGAASGIGRLIALRLAKKGCRLVLWDIDFPSLQSVTNEIREEGGEVYLYRCNVRHSEEVYVTAKRVQDEVGDITVLFNNAGVVTGKKLLSCSDEEIIRTFDVNSIAHFWTIKAFLPSMLENNHGHIVSTASLAGFIGLTGMVDYCASKFAAVGLMESLSREVHASGATRVQFTTVGPSLISTGMFVGCRFRFPNLPGFAILDPEYVASRIIDAVERNQQYLLLPFGSQLAVLAKQLIPVKGIDMLLGFLGGHRAMDTFVGRGKKVVDQNAN